MSLELSSEIESVVRDYDAAEGVSISDAVARRFPPRPSAQDTRDRVQALLTKWQAEFGMPVPPRPHKSLAELSAEWQAESANMTDAERQAEREYQENYERGRDKSGLQFKPARIVRVVRRHAPARRSPVLSLPSLGRKARCPRRDNP